MNWDGLHQKWMRLVSVVAFVALIVGSTQTARAFFPVNFAPVQEVLTNEIASLEANPGPGTQRRLHVLRQANAILNRNSSSMTDGQVLSRLLNLLKGSAFADYSGPLDAAAANLVANFTSSYQFTGSLLNEIPNPRAARTAQARFNALSAMSSRLINSQRAGQVANLYDSASRRVVLVRQFISTLLVVHVPNLPLNTVSANINGVNLRSNDGQSSDNQFSAILTETNTIIIFVHVTDGTSAGLDGSRTLTFSIPMVQGGTFRYSIPDNAQLTFVSDVGGVQTTIAATAGSFFLEVTGNEVRGIFDASADGLTITDGQFRIPLTTLSSE